MRTAMAVRRLSLGAIGAAIGLSSCVSFGVDSYEEFRSAVRSRATCEQLLEMKDNFDATPDEDRVADDLKEIGCETRDSKRTGGGAGG